MKSAPRAAKVVERVAQMADWGRKRDGRGLGFAFIDYSGSQVAGIAEVSLDRRSGQIKVHNFWCTIDCGIPVQPDNVAAQTESSIVYGLGMALTERITIKDGAVEQSNFYDYRVPRMNEIPLMHIEVIATDNHPTGAGQMATPLVAPAISSAVAALTGARLRHTPFTPERVTRASGIIRRPISVVALRSGGELTSVIAGLGPAIHRFPNRRPFRWMRGSSPRMTME